MAFTLTPIAAKDSGGTAIGGGLMAADVAGGGVGPFFMFHGLVDGVAGVNKANITSGNALKVDASATTQPSSVADGSNVTLGAIADAVVTAGASGTASAKLRAISRDIGTVATNSGASLAAGIAVIGGVNISQVTDGTSNAVRLLAETTKIIGVVQGAAASGASASGNPLPAAGLAVSSETVVTNGQAAALITDLARKLIVMPYANPENFVSGAITSAMTGTTSTSLVAAPAAGLRNYLTQITVSNSHATQGTDIIIQDGSGGTTLYVIPAAAVFGGATITLPVPLRQPTTATAIFCANVTTGANTKVSASGYKGA